MDGGVYLRFPDRMPDEDDAAVVDESSREDTGGSFHERYPAVPASVATVRAALTSFVSCHGVPERIREAVVLAVSEAATNVVLHAYRDRAEAGVIEVTAAIANDELWIIVTDTGIGLHPRADSPGLGLGLAIIAHMADGVDLLRPAAGGLELRMRFRLGAGGPARGRGAE